MKKVTILLASLLYAGCAFAQLVPESQPDVVTYNIEVVNSSRFVVVKTTYHYNTNGWDGLSRLPVESVYASPFFWSFEQASHYIISHGWEGR